MTIPERIGRFRIQRTLGQGGMGVVYEGYDEQLDRPVAVKTIAESVSADESSLKGFLLESSAAASVMNRNVWDL